MDPKQRKQAAMDKLDKLYSEEREDGLERQLIGRQDTLDVVKSAIANAQYTRTQTTSGLSLMTALSTGISLFIVGIIGINVIAPILDTVKAQPALESAQTILGLLPLIIAVSVLMVVVSMLGPTYKDS